MGANKKLSKKDISGLSDKDLTARLAEERNALRKLEFTHAVASLENPLSIRAKRRDVARLVTTVNNRTKSTK